MNRSTLTREQRENDYEYLWRVLNECFPMRGTMQRLGYDWDAIKAECQPAVLDACTDLEFCRALNNVFKRMDHFAHLMLFNGRMYRAYQKMYKAFEDGAYENMDREAFAPWIEAVHQPHSEKFYEFLDETDDAGREFYAKDEPHESLAQDKYARKPGPTVSCMMLPGDVAYLKIPTLDMLKIIEDRPVLFDFYAKAKSCKDLIIDIRGNGGGATDYWDKLLVAPTLKETLPEEVYMLFAISPLNEAYITASSNNKNEPFGEIRPMSELPDFPNFHDEYLTQATHFVQATWKHEPDLEHPFEVGRRWLLTDKLVYSSSEGFAVFCKSSGWATIVGERTGGDGIGITPFHAVLPESGLLMRYSAMLGLNNDGGCNAEYHTTPEIECNPSDALAVCLAHITELNVEKNHA